MRQGKMFVLDLVIGMPRKTNSPLSLVTERTEYNQKKIQLGTSSVMWVLQKDLLQQRKVFLCCTDGDLHSEMQWGAVPGLGTTQGCQLWAMLSCNMPPPLCCAAQYVFSSSYRAHVLQPLKATSNHASFLLTFFFIPWLHNVQVGKHEQIKDLLAKAATS